MQHSPRVLYWDLETAPNLAWVWGHYEQNVLEHEQERYILCATWRWEHQKKSNHVSVLDDPDGFDPLAPSDKVVCEKIAQVIEAADLVVAHNGDRFDMRWLNARMLLNNMDPLPPVLQVDTLKVARRKFYFNNNRLDYLGQLLGVGGKAASSKATWMGAVRGDKGAWKEMIKYAKRDTDLLRQVYLAIRPWMDEHPNAANLAGGACCPKCGSIDYISRGYRYTKTRRHRKYQCNTCRGYFTETRSDPEWGSAVFK